MATIILFLLIFGTIVIVHEFGHYLLGRINGIGVLEFSIGMGPRICSFTRKGTIYSLRLLPIGGSCMFLGEDGAEVNPEGREVKGTAFNQAKVWGRIASVAAGPIFNFILAFLFSIVIIHFCGVNKPIISEVLENSPAEEAGLLPGDEITRVNGSKVHFFGEVSLDFAMSGAANVEIEYVRDGVKNTVNVTPKLDEQDGYYYIGIVRNATREELEVSGPELLRYSVHYVGYQLKLTYKSLLMLVRGEVPVTDLAGPVGMAQIVSNTYENAKPLGFVNVLVRMLDLAVLLSVNIGFLNLLPLPALDGGRLVFLLVEVVRGKPISQEKEGMVHFAGFVALMLLMVFVMYNDIVRLVTG